MKNKIGLVSILVLLGFSSALAQGPTLSLVYERAPLGSGYVALVTNSYQAPATGFIVESIYLYPNGRPASQHRLVDCTINLSQKPLSAGETREVTLGPSGEQGQEAHDIRVAAVIFADGHASGEPEWVECLLATRRMIFHDLSTAIKLLNETSDKNVDRQDLMATLKKLGEENITKARDALNATPYGADNNKKSFYIARADQVASMVSFNLEHATSDGEFVPVRDVIKALLKTLTRWYSILENSQPKLS